MVESSSLEVTVDQKIEMGLYLFGSALAVAAAYYTGQSGNWEPLLIIAVLLSLLVLFFTSK